MLTLLVVQSVHVHQAKTAFTAMRRVHLTTKLFILVDRSECRTVSARLVLNTCIPMRLVKVEFSSVRVL